MRRFQGVAASLFACACAAGCGKTTQLADAPTGDSNNADANTTPDAMLAVTVTTYSRSDGSAPNHTLVANVPVYVVSPAGAIAQMNPTNAQGTVSFLGVEPGSSVTAVYTLAGGGYKIVTTLGVKPGDNLVYGDAYPSTHGQLTTPLTMSATFPTVTGATQYYVRHACTTDNGGASPVTINIGCDATNGDFYFYAQNDGGVVLATGALHGAMYADGKTAALTSWTTVTQPMLSVSASNLSAEVSDVNFHAALVVDGVAFNDSRQAFFITPTSNAASATLSVPNGGDRLWSLFEVHNTNATGSWGNKVQFQALASDVRTVTDTEPGLPWLSPMTFDAANQKVTWTTEGSGAYDGMLVNVTWSDATPTNYDWDIIAPPGVTSFSWANPPAALAPYVPAATVTPNSNNNVTALVDLSNTTGYDALRQQPEWFLSNTGFATEDGELATGSTIAMPPGGEGYFPY